VLVVVFSWSDEKVAAASAIRGSPFAIRIPLAESIFGVLHLVDVCRA